MQAELPWHADRTVQGTLMLEDEALVVVPSGPSRRAAIPLRQVVRSSVVTTLGVKPVLHVWHMIAGEETLSRFEFLPEHDEEEEPTAFGIDLANRVGPGLARDAASRLEGGLKALSGGLKGGRRTVRQVVDGVSRQDEYRTWPGAIAQAQEVLRRRKPARAEARVEPPPAAPPPLFADDVRIPLHDPGEALAWFFAHVPGWLAECGARARALHVQQVPVIAPWYPLESPVCRIVVVGEFSRGKSTLINALFGIHGEIALPTGMTPTTPLACAIRVPQIGESDGATITYRTRRPALQLTLDEFRSRLPLEQEGGADSGGEDLRLDEARRVEVRITGAYLQAGVEIEDTPGLHEQAQRSVAAEAALGRADLVLFVLAADQLLSDLEMQVIDSTLRLGHHRNVLFLVNFWETIDDDQQRAILRQRASSLLHDFPSALAAPTGSALPIVYVSALRAQRAQRQRKPAPEDSGIPALREALRELLGPGVSSLMLRARAGRALRFVTLLRTSVSKAGAASATGRGESPQRAHDALQEEALAAARRLLNGLTGAVLGSASAVISTFRSSRVMPGGAAVGSESVRTLLVEARAATTASRDGAQQTLDLVAAQCRAAFMMRSLPAPALTTQFDLETPQFPAAAMDEASWRDQAADALLDALRSSGETARERLGAALAEAADGMGSDPRSTDPGPSPVADDRVRLAALRALEDDLVRLQHLLEPLLDA